MSKIAVFPASGALGSSVRKHLVRLLDPKQLVFVSRHPEKIPREYTEAGVTTRQADYDAPETLEKVFDDVSTLVLISYPSIAIDHRFEAHKAAIAAARRSSPGVKHIFYTSLGFAGNGDETSAAHVMQAHLKTEAYLKSLANESSNPITFTAIREGIYSESWPMYTGYPDVKNLPDQVKIPHDGKGPGISWVKIDDLGEGTAQLVKRNFEQPDAFSYTNRVVLLSGSKAWSIEETLDLLGKIKGQKVGVKEVSVDEYASQRAVQENLEYYGSVGVAKDWASSFEGIRRGETSVVTADLENLLGRAPEDFEKTLRDLLSN